MRTAKSCGPDAPTLASSFLGSKLLGERGWQESPVTRESAKEPVKPSRRESRMFPVEPVVLPPCFFCTGPTGAIGTRLSLRPCVPEICQNVTTGGSNQPPVAGTEPVAPKDDGACRQSEGQLRCLPHPEQLQGLRARTRQGREWMMTQNNPVVVGIDVAKDKVDG